MSRWRRVVRRELARYEEETAYDVFELGELYDALTDAPLSGRYLQRHSRTLDWW